MMKLWKGWGTGLAVAGGLAALAGASNAAGAADVRPVEGPALKRAVAAQKGKVVLLNLWATWCSPCVTEFPDLVKLDNNYRNKGVVVLSASLDEPENKGKVDAFLVEQKAAFPAYMRSKGEQDPFIKPLDKSWDGGVPMTFVYNRAGRLVGKPHLGRQTYAELEKLVKQALAK